MKAPRDSGDEPAVRLAFYGRTNGPGSAAAIIVARQFLTCRVVIGGHAVFTRAFYDLPSRVDDEMVLAVRNAGGPSRWDGGWDELAAAIPNVDRGFSAIVCSSVDRIGRRSSVVHQRHQLALEHGVVIGVAEMPCEEILTASPSFDRLAALARTGPCTWDSVLERRQVGGP